MGVATGICLNNKKVPFEKEQKGKPMKLSYVIIFALIAISYTAPVFAQASQEPDIKTENDRVPGDFLDPVTRCAIGRFMNFPNCDIKQAVARGVFETGLKPRFPENVSCREIDEGYAISYTHKRDREPYHGGIDIPTPWETPVVAAAGTVVGKFYGEKSFRGIEIVIRHSPKDTGLPLWLYTQYTHFSEMPPLEIGQRVLMGQVVGPTGNSGIGRTGRQGNKRRPAVHFGVFYSKSRQYADIHDRIIPVDGYWMDPIALFWKILPLDSYSMKALPDAEKQILISVMLDNGETSPTDTKIIWPYPCTRISNP